MTTKTLPAAALLAVALLGVAGCGDDAGSARSAQASASGGTTAAASTAGSPAASGTASGAASGTASGAAASVEPAAAEASASATTTLGLVDGFPVDLVPVLPGATVTASTVSAQGDRLEVSLSGTTTKTRKAVLAYYGKVFEKAGYTRPKGNRIGPGTVNRVWARGDDVVVVAVDNGRPRSFSVGGTVTR